MREVRQQSDSKDRARRKREERQQSKSKDRIRRMRELRMKRGKEKGQKDKILK